MSSSLYYDSGKRMSTLSMFIPSDAMGIAAMLAGAYLGWWLTQGSSDMVHYGAALAGGGAGVFIKGAFTGEIPIAFGGF